MVLKNLHIYIPSTRATKITDILLKTKEELKDSDLTKIVLLSKELNGSGAPFSWELLKNSKNQDPKQYLENLKTNQKNYIAIALTPADLEIETSRNPWFLNPSAQLITTPTTTVLPVNNATSRRLMKYAKVTHDYLQRKILQYQL